MNDTHEELRELITRVVTGDGAQLENLSMHDAEWEVIAQDEGNIMITVPVEEWLEMLEVARNHTGTYPEGEEGK